MIQPDINNLDGSIAVYLFLVISSSWVFFPMNPIHMQLTEGFYSTLSFLSGEHVRI